MSPTRLSTVRGATEVTQYVNGRRLSARDLRDERSASQAADRIVARGAGYGVIDGLTVERHGLTTLKVYRGCGLTRSGRIIDLYKDHTLNLLYPAREIVTLKKVISKRGRTGIFDDCDTEKRLDIVERPSRPGTKGFGLDPDGVYLLVARPYEAELDDPHGALDTEDCENQRLSYGVAFASVLFFELDDPKGGPILRNRMAHLAFGDAWTAQRLGDPFSIPAASPLDRGIDGALDGDKDALPLALYLWQDQKIVWVDMWAGRRRVVQPSAASLNPSVGVMDASLQFEAWISDRAAANGEARLYQFQDAFASYGITCESSVLDYFRWLPPAGYLPLCAQEDVTPGTENRIILSMVAAQLEELIQRQLIWPIRQHLRGDVNQGAVDQITRELISILLRQYQNALPDPQAGVLMENFWADYRDEEGELCARWGSSSLLEAHEILAGIPGTWRDCMIDLTAREPIRIHNTRTEALYFRVELWRALRQNERMRELLQAVLANEPEFVEALVGRLIDPLNSKQAQAWSEPPPTLYAIFTRGRKQEPRFDNIG